MVSTDGPALPQRSGCQQPLLPTLVVPRTEPIPALQMGWSQKGDTPPRRGSWTRWHCQPCGPSGHLHGLDDGDHISLTEGQLASLGLGVVMLGDALRPRRPMFLQEEGSVTGMLSPEVSPSWKDHMVTWDGDNIPVGWDAPVSHPCAGAVQERTVSPTHPGHDWLSAHQGLLSAPDVTCREETKWGHKEMRLSQSPGLIPTPSTEHSSAPVPHEAVAAPCGFGRNSLSHLLSVAHSCWGHEM